MNTKVNADLYVSARAPHRLHLHRCWHFNADTPLRVAAPAERVRRDMCQDCTVDAKRGQVRDG